MNFAIIIYHKNINKYPQEWIRLCLDSIFHQTFKKFTVFELDYGGDGIQVYQSSDFRTLKLPTHADAHNYLLDLAFKLSFDYVFNVNIDDYYALDRFAKQVKYAESGYDIISSNFYNIDGNGNILNSETWHDKNIEAEAAKEHNIIAHPVVCYSRNFWTKCSRLIPSEIPYDDFNLWKRSYKDFKFIILPEFLLYYRVHTNKIGGLQNSQNPEKALPPSNTLSKEEMDEIHNKKRDEWLKNNN